MERDWSDREPIYRQLRDRVVAMILDGSLGVGDAVPSVRQVAGDFRINPITVMKAYQELADEGVLEKRRGLGLFVTEAARTRLLADERQAFLEQRWPEIRDTMARLGLSLSDLPGASPLLAKPENER